MAHISLAEAGTTDTTPIIKYHDQNKKTLSLRSKKIYVLITIIVILIIATVLIVIVVLDSTHSDDTKSSFRSGPPVDNPTSSYWLQDAPFQDINTGPFPNEVDITIIGAGISGSAILYHLVKSLNAENNTINNISSILIIDARGASGGATGRNGGIMQILGATAFNSTLNNFDENTASSRYNFSKQTIEDMVQFINDNNISANLRLNPTISTMITNDTQYLDSIQTVIDNMQTNYNIGFENKLLDTDEMRNISKSNIWTHGILKDNYAYILWPAKVVFALLNYSILHTNNTINDQRFSNLNLNIQFNKLVNSVDFNENSQKWQIKTSDGDEVKTKIVVYATNGYTSYLLPEYGSKISPVKNQVILSKIVNETIWSDAGGGFGDDFQYYNQRESGRILIGGGREIAPNNWINNYDDSDIDETVEKYLQNYLYEYYPKIADGKYMDEIYMQWQGIMGFTNDGLPYIGPLVNKKNAYICAGYTGSGMSYAFNAGNAISDMILNKDPSPFVEAFLPSARNQ